MFPSKLKKTKKHFVNFTNYDKCNEVCKILTPRSCFPSTKVAMQCLSNNKYTLCMVSISNFGLHVRVSESFIYISEYMKKMKERNVL